VINTSADRDTDNIHRLYNCEELQQMYLHNVPAYVYFVKHISSNKFYFGSRYKHIEKNLQPEEDLWKSYFTSSKEIKSLLKQGSVDDFEVSILMETFDLDFCFEYEQSIIKENINNPLCLNKRYFDSSSGTRVFRTFGKTLSTKGKPKSEFTRQKMSKPKTKKHRENLSRAQLLNGGNGPKNHTKETKNKIREAMKLNPRPNKICPYCKKTGGFLSMSRWHFENCKEKHV
jgi:hypothetical protein